jgi:hypothetical protein
MMSQMKQLLLRLGFLGVFLFRGEEKHRMEAQPRLDWSLPYSPC